MNKVMTMKEAISKNVKSGDLLFIAGSQHGVPNAAVHEIVRQKIDHLTLVSVLMGSATLMISEGLIDRMITGYTQQDDKRSYALQRAKAMNKLPVFEESSHFGVSLALTAGQMGIPFMPCRVLVGSDMLKYNENIKSFECPFTGGQLGAIKAVVPDAGIIHVQRADAEGNAQKWGSLGVDQEGINASQRVVVVTEKIVDSDVIRKDPNITIIPGFRVDAVVEQPFGAYSSHLAGCYDGDMGAMRATMGGEEAYQNYLDTFIYGVDDWDGYMEKVKESRGEDCFEKLRIKNTVIGEPVIHGHN
ncbi:CoA transferase subunit A [Chloroflexota bacterium]